MIKLNKNNNPKLIKLLNQNQYHHKNKLKNYLQINKILNKKNNNLLIKIALPCKKKKIKIKFNLTPFLIKLKKVLLYVHLKNIMVYELILIEA
jgi:hypothetical protein